MPKTPEQFKPQKQGDERVDDVELAEGMAYAEKPYRDESIRRKNETQARYDFIHSDAYREHLRKLEEEHLALLKDYVSHLDEHLRERAERNQWQGYSEDKIQKIKERYIRRFKNYLVWNEQRFEEYVQEMVKGLDESEFNEAEVQRAKDWDEGPIPAGIQKAEDYRRTYLRRAKQKPLSEDEALKEGSQVRERAKEEAEARLEYGKLLKDFQGRLKHFGWEELKKYNEVRNWLDKPLDEHIRLEDYEEALEYIERLKEIPIFNLASWLKAQVELKALELKDLTRRRKEKSK